MTIRTLATSTHPGNILVVLVDANRHGSLNQTAQFKVDRLVTMGTYALLPVMPANLASISRLA